ncbi:hypothetical protein [Chryseobacterium sp.]|uniref:hypothetical protein n=1 Tax=Chryseobacterium sp. TaxID=1871047 RepID=UPI002FC9AB96
MEKLAHASLEDFYLEMTKGLGKDMESIFPKGLHKDIGHFNVFDIAQTIANIKYRIFEPTDSAESSQ